MYVCPKCGGENWLTLPEAKQYGKFVCFLCQESTPIEPMSGVTVNYTSCNQGKTEHCPSSLVKVVDTQRFVDMLVALGHKKSQARTLVDNAIAEGHYTGTDEAFVQHLCSVKI